MNKNHSNDHSASYILLYHAIRYFVEADPGNFFASFLFNEPNKIINEIMKDIRKQKTFSSLPRLKAKDIDVSFNTIAQHATIIISTPQTKHDYRENMIAVAYTDKRPLNFYSGKFAHYRFFTFESESHIEKTQGICSLYEWDNGNRIKLNEKLPDSKKYFLKHIEYALLLSAPQHKTKLH